VVVGQRAALESAQKRKQDAEEIVDSIVADDMGKLPDKSVTEVLQRMPGVTIDRTMNRQDPQQGVGDGIMRFAAEGTGVSIRGMSYVRSELNGRDSFSANGGRSLSFEDVPPELMAGIDVYKSPSAEQIEGAVGGLPQGRRFGRSCAFRPARQVGAIVLRPVLGPLGYRHRPVRRLDRRGAFQDQYAQ
jgi:TonB-dependent receptor